MPHPEKVLLPDALAAIDKQTLADWRATARLSAIRALKKCILASGVKQHSIATKLGCNDAQLSRLLRGDRNFTIDSLSDVARAIGHRLEVQFCKIPSKPTRNYHVSYILDDIEPSELDEDGVVKETETYIPAEDKILEAA
jgi:transcriptional regulator with XRE-family HTH domain